MQCTISVFPIYISSVEKMHTKNHANLFGNCLGQVTYELFHPIFVFRLFWPTKLQKCLSNFLKSLALQTETTENQAT